MPLHPDPIDAASAAQVLAIAVPAHLERPGGAWTRILSRKRLDAATLDEAVASWPSLTPKGRVLLLGHPALTPLQRAMALDWITLLSARQDGLTRWSLGVGSWVVTPTLTHLKAPGIGPEVPLTPDRLPELALRPWPMHFLAFGGLPAVRDLPPATQGPLIEAAARRWRPHVVQELLHAGACPRPLIDGALAQMAQIVEARHLRPKAVGHHQPPAPAAGEPGAARTGVLRPAADPASWQDLKEDELARAAEQLSFHPGLDRADLETLLAFTTQRGLQHPRPTWDTALRLLQHPAYGPAARSHWWRTQAAQARRSPWAWQRQGDRDEARRPVYALERSRAVAIRTWPVRDQIRMVRHWGVSLSLLSGFVKLPGALPPDGPALPVVRSMVRSLWGRTLTQAGTILAERRERRQFSRGDVHAAIRETADEVALLETLCARPDTAAELAPFLVERWLTGDTDLPWSPMQEAAMWRALRSQAAATHRLLRHALLSSDQTRREQALRLLVQLRGEAIAEAQTTPGARGLDADGGKGSARPRLLGGLR